MRATVLIPTYNERDSLAATVDKLLAAAPDIDIIVIDDASPDGTGELADRLATADARISVLHRPAKQGLGAAYIDGMRVALERGAEAVIEFDADGSHPADAVPRMLERLKPSGAADHVIGSRWIEGGGIVDWPWHRQAISRLGNLYAKTMLSSDVRDMTAGCRAFTAELLRSISLDEVQSEGYCFQVDMTRRALDEGARIEEVPITFREREQGVSKMTGGIVREALVQVTGWGIGRAARRVGERVSAVGRRLTPGGDSESNPAPG